MKTLFWLGYSLLAFVTAVFIAWQLLLKVDFLYPLWYELLAIDRTIQTFGPANRYRRHFEITAKREHHRLFAAIVDSIRHQGRGLDQLSYHNPAGRSLGRFLTRAEVIHLHDVSRLVQRWHIVGWTSLLLWITFIGVIAWRRLPLPALKTLLSAVLIITAGIGLVCLLVGPVRVFYQLHRWLFPPDHPWFFYYEDSLMTMLMKAPALFGPVAVLWIALSLVIFILASILIEHWQKRRLSADFNV